MYRFRKIVQKSNFSEQCRKPINRYKRIGYSLDIMQQTACLVINPVIVDGYASLVNCTSVWASDSVMAFSSNFNQWIGAWRYVFSLARHGSTIGFHLRVLWHTGELPWVLVFVYHSDYFNFYVFALMHWLSWELLCEPNFYIFLY